MYQVLARKYRPRNFNELVGQNHVSRALTSALDRGRLHHAYLFTGTRGVGKTTIARILAKCLNCETGVTSTPCEVCATCKAVNEGRFIDLIEIDAASRTKVEDTRELLDNVPYAPTQGRFKVYLIDEVHMLSTHSFNALLKTLEEPPEHVKFLFATTDPQKLPITVISRCLQFTLRPLAVDEITHHLTNILNKEEIQSEQDAIWQIAESAQGSLRDALSLTDQAIAYGQGAIHHQDVKEMLGLIDRTIIYDLILAIHQNQRERVSQLLLQFRQQALDVSLVLDQFISTLHELAMLQYLPDLSLKYSAEINQKIMTLSQLVSAQDLQLYYQIACKGRAELQLAVTQEQGFEMTVLRLLAFRPIQVNEVVVSQQQVSQQIESNVVIESNSSLNSAPLNPEAVQAVPVQEVQSQDSSSFDPDLEEVEEQLAQQSIADPEPSSDDYLDEEVENSNDQFTNVQNENAQHLEQSENEQIVADVQGVIVNSEIQQVVQVEAAEPSLTLFGGEISPQPVVQDQTQDVFFLAPESDREIADTSVAVENAVQKHAQTVQQDHSQLESTQTQVTTTHAVQSSHHQTPQEILSLQPQILEGEWTVDKWEYWFRNSSLSPAVQELAQHGLMIGTINGQSTFQTSKQYENLLNQTQHDLEASLKQQWSSTVFNVQYGEVETITPFMMQRERKVRAFDRASEMLHQEPIVKSLMEAFDGQLENIQLK
ncbi:DNA polymerase III subunit gamma/tau [Acinetobacter wuhouensis]|uniref:DNA polymerase III subunit gamma/tau n=1 Tax=Acinetobacter wuhouensis TaxID=1879050 RepID=A0A3G2T1J1_9GAMM|nr:DNA polymerase III subunit gamma/tau [Acinetobacter wuhouensis]AYO54048.1 DNA polymerase III subunit gamma/tau [Acinetobacter wuhouensis]